MTNSSNDKPILERYDQSFVLNAKNTRFSVYVAESDGDYSPNESDFKLVGEEFIIE